MSEFTRALQADLSLKSITPWSDESGLWGFLVGQSPSSGTWSTANGAVYVPFRLAKPFVVASIGWHNGATVSGNVDAGIYDISGARLAHTGSTAQVTINVLQLVALSVTLAPGYYYLALAVDNTTATMFRFTLSSTVNPCSQALQFQTQTSAFPLPSPATLANQSGSINLPYFGIFEQAVA